MGEKVGMRRRLNAASGVFVIMAIVIISSTIVTYWFGQRVIRTRALQAAHFAVITEAGQVLSSLKDAETGQRGFTITGDPKYLEPFHAAQERLAKEIETLRTATQVSVPKSEIDAIADLAHQRVSELERVIDTRQTEGFDAAAALVRTGAGKRTMDAVRAEVDHLQNQQRILLQQEIASDAQATRIRTLAFIGTGILNLLFILWAYERITRAIRGQEVALREAEFERNEVQRQKDLLAVTLASIGDCVIVTDTAGRVTFMNAVAESLTGWTLAEAHLQPTAKVFNIVNEETRKPVGSPVEKVLQHGVIVGLANHTLLIRKDGSEVPIDDSGAPIRDADGRTKGVVLVFRDFSEHKENERKLQSAKEAAENANRAKDQFLAMLSHELRTPLTPVLATLNLWEASDEVPSTMRSDVQMLRRNVELEARIIDDLLDLTRIAKGMLSFFPEDTDVHELLEFLVGICHSEFHGKQLVLKMQLNAASHHVHTDASRLQQIFWNIIRNAAKFTERDGTVTISTRNDEAGNIVLSVADTGIGMTPETLSRLFLPFEQGEERISRRYGGLGLGMAISSALVELLGGKLTAQSAGLGHGSTFTVTFPTAEAGKVEKKPADERTSAQLERSRVKILLVEDHYETACALVRLLKNRGYAVETADTVASASAAMKNGKFDLLISDIGLPDGTGFELIEEVRRSSNTPALALSGFGMEEDVAKCMSAGFEGHLTKPVNFQKLEAAIWKLTGR
jgi:PAS domain S-box-containing protein